MMKGDEDWFSKSLNRELGFTHPTSFIRRVSASKGIVQRLDLYTKLDGHEGCVNAIEFNSTGDRLVSGSDDTQVIFWNWATKSQVFSYLSGHLSNVFQTKIMPFSDDRTIVTCAADGQVRIGRILEGGSVNTKRLGEHQGAVFKLAVEPGSPYILYSCCGSVGTVQHHDLRTSSSTQLFSCSSFTDSSIAVALNSIVIDPRNPNYLAVGGSNEYVRLYDLRKYRRDASTSLDRPVDTFCPKHLKDGGSVHITGLAYSNTSELLVSYNDELIYMFQKDMGFGSDPLQFSSEELHKLEEPRVYSGHRNSRTIKGVNFFGPNDEYVVSGSDCGHIFIWEKKTAKLVRLMVGDSNVVNQLEQHPHMPVLATAGIETSVKIWSPVSKEVQPLPRKVDQIMKWNTQGREDRIQLALTPAVIMHVLRLQRRQAMDFAERRADRADVENEGEDEDSDEERATYVLSFSDNEDVSGEDPRECNID